MKSMPLRVILNSSTQRWIPYQIGPRKISWTPIYPLPHTHIVALPENGEGFLVAIVLKVISLENLHIETLNTVHETFKEANECAQFLNTYLEELN